MGGEEQRYRLLTVSKTLMSLFLVVTLRKQKSKLWNQQRKLKVVYLVQVDTLLMFASYMLWHLLAAFLPEMGNKAHFLLITDLKKKK